LFALSRRLSVQGFDARALLADQDERRHIEQALQDAIALLGQYAPLRLAYLRRDLPRVWVGTTHNRAECLAAASMCVLQFEYIANPSTSPVSIAMTLVHEGTHARLLRLGFGYEESRRRRLERLCVLTEILFAKRVPGAAAEIQQTEGQLARDDEFWSNAAFRRRALAHLENLGWEGKIGFQIARWGLALKRFFTRRAA
jgi:hypothetical protein